MKKYLIKYSYIPDDGVPIIKTDYAIVEPFCAAVDFSINFIISS